MSSPAAKSLYAGHRFPAEVISQAVWLYFRFPLSLRMVEEMLAARGIVVSHETVRRWALKFGREFANRIRRRLPRAGDKWHLDEVAIKIAGVKHSTTLGAGGRRAGGGREPDPAARDPARPSRQPRPLRQPARARRPSRRGRSGRPAPGR